MKKMTIFFLLILALLITSCKNENPVDNVQVENQKIIDILNYFAD